MTLPLLSPDKQDFAYAVLCFPDSTSISVHVYSTFAASKQLFCFLLVIQAYSNWPTIPQAFMRDKFMGGCDIMLHMYCNGDLAEDQKAAMRLALLNKKKTKLYVYDNL
jgi:hypothetical protein